jgi:CheY-like chemotaxis protein
LKVDQEFNPEVGVLDIGLPVMNGYELARHLQAQGEIRLVAVTGYGQQSDQERSRAAGFVAHLVKPIALDELARVLHRLCQPAR